MKITAFFIVILLSFTSRAFSLSTSAPFARMNTSKTHYLVSVPKKMFADKEGYTAVFDAKTHRLKFRIDRYFRDKMVFLSDDGMELIFVNRREDANQTCELQFYTKDGESRAVFVLHGKYTLPDDCGVSYSSILGCLQEPGKIALYTRDSVYSVSYNLSQIKTHTRVLEEKDQNKKFESGFLRADSLFGIKRLIAGRKLFSKKLAADLDLKSVPQFESTKSIYFRLHLQEDGTLSVFQADATDHRDTETGNWKRDQELNGKLRSLIRNYRYKRNLVPKGLPYWPFNGQLYFSEMNEGKNESGKHM